LGLSISDWFFQIPMFKPVTPPVAWFSPQLLPYIQQAEVTYAGGRVGARHVLVNASPHALAAVSKDPPKLLDIAQIAAAAIRD